MLYTQNVLRKITYCIFLLKNYQRHLTLRAIGTEDFAMLGDADSLALDQMRDADEHSAVELPTPARRGRKRKNVEEPVSNDSSCSTCKSLNPINIFRVEHHCTSKNPKHLLTSLSHLRIPWA